MQLDPTTDESFRQFLPGMQQEDDRALIIEFFTQKKLLGAKSQELGREIYEDREYVKIQIKGQDKQTNIEEVKAHHRQKFPIAYQQFQLRRPAPLVGTPIEQLPGVGPSQAHHLKGLNLRSIEDVANISDENTLQRVGMGARELVGRAKAWLTQSNDKAVALEQENAELKKALAAMNERIDALSKATPKAARKPRRKKARRAARAAQPQAQAPGA